MELTLSEDGDVGGKSTEQMALGVTSERVRNRGNLPDDVCETADWLTDALWESTSVELTSEQAEHVVEICEVGMENRNDHAAQLEDIRGRVRDAQTND